MASESAEEFFARLSRNRKERIMACGNPEDRAGLLAIDQAADTVDRAAKMMFNPTNTKKGTP